LVDLGEWQLACDVSYCGADDISPHLAIRLELAGVSTARFWMCLQANCDLAQALKHDQPPVEALQDKVARPGCFYSKTIPCEFRNCFRDCP
jgi:hypothetical protein